PVRREADVAPGALVEPGEHARAGARRGAEDGVPYAAERPGHRREAESRGRDAPAREPDGDRGDRGPARAEVLGGEARPERHRVPREEVPRLLGEGGAEVGELGRRRPEEQVLEI